MPILGENLRTKPNIMIQTEGEKNERAAAIGYKYSYIYIVTNSILFNKFIDFLKTSDRYNWVQLTVEPSNPVWLEWLHWNILPDLQAYQLFNRIINLDRVTTLQYKKYNIILKHCQNTTKTPLTNSYAAPRDQKIFRMRSLSQNPNKTNVKNYQLVKTPSHPQLNLTWI